MKVKNFERIAVCIMAAIMAIVIVCSIAFGTTMLVFAQGEGVSSVFTGYSEGLTEKELYDETNTYSYKKY